MSKTTTDDAKLLKEISISEVLGLITKDRDRLAERVADLESQWKRATAWIPAKGAWLPEPNVAVQLRMAAPPGERDFTTVAYIHRTTGRWVSVNGGAEIEQSRVLGWRNLLPIGETDADGKDVTA